MVFGLGFVVGSAQVLHYRSDARKLLFAAMMFVTIPLNAIGVLATGSRGASAATAAGLLVLVLVSKLGPKRLVAIVLAVMVLVVPFWSVYVDVSQVLTARWERTLTRDEYGARDRLFAVTTELFLQRPLIGYGVQSSSIIGERFFGNPNQPFAAHSTIMTLLVSFGMLGTVLWIAMLASALTHVWRHRRAEHAGLLLAILGMFMAYMFTGSIMTNRFFYVTLGLATCVHHWQSSVRDGANVLADGRETDQCARPS